MLLEQSTVLISCKRVVSWPGNGYDKIPILKNIIYLLHLINDSTKIECSKNSQLPYTMKFWGRKVLQFFICSQNFYMWKFKMTLFKYCSHVKYVGFHEIFFAKVYVYSLPWNFYGIQYYIAVCFAIINTNLMYSNYSKMGSV